MELTETPYLKGLTYNSVAELRCIKKALSISVCRGK